MEKGGEYGRKGRVISKGKGRVGEDQAEEERRRKCGRNVERGEKEGKVRKERRLSRTGGKKLRRCGVEEEIKESKKGKEGETLVEGCSSEGNEGGREERWGARSEGYM